MQISRCTKADFDQILTHIEEFWGRESTLGLHHPTLLHEFGDTAYVIRDGAAVAAYLFGYLSQAEPAAYVHLVGVRAPYRRRGLARRLYAHFVDYARSRGCTDLKAIATPENAASIAFHKSLGMELVGTPNRDGVPVVKDYAGPGKDRVVFHMTIAR
jgi:GNAT superfamily N-acetyltransferase